MNKKTKIISLTLVVIMSSFFCVGTLLNFNHKSTVTARAKNTKKTEKENSIENIDRDIIKFEMQNGETFEIALYPECAPITVNNFTNLVKEGFYNGLTFHRVVEGFMAQGGDPIGDGTGSSETKIIGEFSENNCKSNTLKHERGTVSMARSSQPNSASCQFFICYKDTPFLDGKYAAFGKVIKGMETIDNFLKIERKENAMGEVAIPVDPLVISSASFVEQS